MQSTFWFCSSILVTLALLVTNIDAYEEREILSKKFANREHEIRAEKLESNQRDYVERSLQYLYNLTKEEKQTLLDVANTTLLKHVWHIGTATEYMQYYTTGNRINFETILSKYHTRLCQLVVGHLLRKETNSTDKYFLNEIVDGLWTLLQQTTWICPAHLYLEKGYKVLQYDHLPDPNNTAIDLSTGEIAKLVASIQMFMREDLEAVSPALNRRVDFELNKKVYYPYLHYQHEWKQGTDVSNHNSWTNSNIFRSALINLKNVTLFNRIADDVYRSVDYLLNRYGDDGALSEGPAYWRQNSGRIIELVFLMCQLYPDAEPYFQNVTLIKKMGDYALAFHIDHNWFVNFGDSHPQLSYPPELLQIFGDLYQNQDMKDFAWYMYQKPNNSEFVRILGSDRQLTDFFDLLAYKTHFDTMKPEKLAHSQMNYLDSIQVLTTRSNATKSLFLGAKFATNNENHNHNDVGTFLLFQNGQPMFIDVGTGAYNASTWSSLRYTFMYYRSSYHNVPTINGVEQFENKTSVSTDVSLEQTADGASKFCGNIAKTYPEQAMVKQWYRCMIFDPNKNIFQLNDQYELTEFLAPQTWNFVTHARTRIEHCDQGLLIHSDNNETMLMAFDRRQVDIQLDRWDVFQTDHSLKEIWGTFIQRIRLIDLKGNNDTLSGNLTVLFVPQ